MIDLTKSATMARAATPEKTRNRQYQLSDEIDTSLDGIIAISCKFVTS